MDNTDIGLNFKRIREDRNLNIIEFADMVKSNKSTWSRIERGKKKTLSYSEILEYCDNGNICVSDILGEDYGKSITKGLKFKSIKYKKYYYDLKLFRLLIFGLAIILTVISVFIDSMIVSTSFIFTWLFYFLSEMIVIIFKSNSNIPTLSYELSEYPFLITTISKKELDNNYKKHIENNCLVLVTSFLFHIFLVGGYGQYLSTDFQAFISLIFIFTLGWELYIYIDYDNKKYFTRKIFFEGLPKHYDLYKYYISYIVMIISVLNYWAIVKFTTSIDSLLTISLSLITLIYVLINIIRIKNKEYYLSLYSINFEKK